MSNWNDPEFLRCAVKHGLLNAAKSGPMDAYELEGFLLNDSFFRKKRLSLGIPAGLNLPFAKVMEMLTPAEMVALRERVLGVVPFNA